MWLFDETLRTATQRNLAIVVPLKRDDPQWPEAGDAPNPGAPSAATSAIMLAVDA
jgi:hypothetical protein